MPRWYILFGEPYTQVQQKGGHQCLTAEVTDCAKSRSIPSQWSLPAPSGSLLLPRSSIIF